jgi:aspartate kinase
MIVSKFGGSCLSDQQSILKVAEKIHHAQKNNEQPVVVVSALRGKTSYLVDLFDQMVPASAIDNADRTRERDLIISTGEQIAAGLLSLAVQNYGIQAKAYNA